MNHFLLRIKKNPTLSCRLESSDLILLEHTLPAITFEPRLPHKYSSLP